MTMLKKLFILTVSLTMLFSAACSKPSTKRDENKAIQRAEQADEKLEKVVEKSRK